MVSNEKLIEKVQKVKENMKKTPIQQVYVVRNYAEHLQDIKTIDKVIEVLKKCDLK